MIVLEDPSTPEGADAPAGARFSWFPADDATGFDPVTDVGIGDGGQVDADWMAAVVEHCAQGLALLEHIDPSGFDAATTTAWAKGVEQLRRQAAAAGIAVTDHLDTASPFEDLGFFTA